MVLNGSLVEFNVTAAGDGHGKLKGKGGFLLVLNT